MTKVLTMKNRIALAAMLLAAVALVVMALGLYGNGPVKAEDKPVEKRTMSVSGQAKVNASPDMAYITLGVITEEKDAKAAQKANAAAMDKVIVAIKASGIKEDDIKTVNYTIYPKYDYAKESGVSMIVGYTASNSVRVTVRDVTKTGSVIDAAADSGVNTSSNISFELSDYEKFYNDALKNAVLAAKKKADTMAEALGVTIKAPISVNEGGGYSPLRNYVTYDMKAADGAMSSTPIEAGSLEISANVSIVYEY